MLQELIVPASADLFSVQGIRLGDKKSIEHYIHEITNFPHVLSLNNRIHVIVAGLSDIRAFIRPTG